MLRRRSLQALLLLVAMMAVPPVSFANISSADLSITKTDGADSSLPGDEIVYTIIAGNAGADDVTGATVTDLFPAALTACTWTCAASAGSSCTAAGAGDINDSVNLLNGGTATYTVACTIDPSAMGTLENTATVSSTIPDPNTSDNSATDTNTLTILAPTALEVDPEVLTSDGNRVFEPGETVEVAPSWANDGVAGENLGGTATAFTGPAGADYTIAADAADYGLIGASEEASCLDIGVCYQLQLDDPAVRPAPHWEATFDEELSVGLEKSWTLHIGDSFTDVPRTHLFYRFVETLVHHSVSGDAVQAIADLGVTGCSGTEFCPASPSTRAQSAVFLIKAVEGGGHVPPACTDGEEEFADVPFDDPFCPWIEDLADRGVTAGCDGDNFCPDDPVTRAQSAVFLLKTLEGAGYTPTPCAESFDDVPCSSLFADWIEDLAGRGITAGCGDDNFCPGEAVTRGQIAVFITKTFGLLLYGP